MVSCSKAGFYWTIRFLQRLLKLWLAILLLMVLGLTLLVQAIGMPLVIFFADFRYPKAALCWSDSSRIVYNGVLAGYQTRSDCVGHNPSLLWLAVSHRLKGAIGCGCQWHSSRWGRGEQWKEKGITAVSSVREVLNDFVHSAKWLNRENLKV